jgi:hypothetical protein
MKYKSKIIPAIHGYSVLEPVGLDDGDNATVYRADYTPILAWEVRKKTETATDYHRGDMASIYVYPITPDGRAEDDAVIAYPDGTVRISPNESFDSAGDWLAYHSKFMKSLLGIKPAP